VDGSEQRRQVSKGESCSADQDADAERAQKNHWILRISTRKDKSLSGGAVCWVPPTHLSVPHLRPVFKQQNLLQPV